VLLQLGRSGDEERRWASLRFDQRAVFVLHHHVGLPLVTVAETLGIPDGAARS
jgi:DNA-directed RNA polymerase specialized sigma24 family protein